MSIWTECLATQAYTRYQVDESLSSPRFPSSRPLLSHLDAPHVRKHARTTRPLAVAGQARTWVVERPRQGQWNRTRRWVVGVSVDLCVNVGNVITVVVVAASVVPLHRLLIERRLQASCRLLCALQQPRRDTLRARPTRKRFCTYSLNPSFFPLRQAAAAAAAAVVFVVVVVVVDVSSSTTTTTTTTAGQQLGVRP